MYRIDIFRRKPDGNRGAFLCSAYFPDKFSADAAYNMYRKMSYRGLQCAPRDIEVMANDQQRLEEIAKSHQKVRVWTCTYDENAYCNKDTGEDHRYTWSFEEVDNPNKIDIEKIKAPEFRKTRYLSNIVVTKPIMSNKY